MPGCNHTAALCQHLGNNHSFTKRYSMNNFQHHDKKKYIYAETSQAPGLKMGTRNLVPKPILDRQALHSYLHNRLSLFICSSDLLWGWEAAQPLDVDDSHYSASFILFLKHQVPWKRALLLRHIYQNKTDSSESSCLLEPPVLDQYDFDYSPKSQMDED